MIKAVIFDLDGTLIDSTDALVDSFTHMFHVIGEPPATRQAIVDSVGHPLEEQLKFLTRHDTEECIRIYRAHYESTSCEKTVLLPGAREAIAAFLDTGLVLGFATSKKRAAAEMLLEHLGVLDAFTGRVGPHDVTHAKPHPEAVLKCLEALGVSADEAFFVGDMHFDVLAAQAANVRCIAVTTGYETRAQLEPLAPEAVFDTLDEVRDYVLAECTQEVANRAL